MTRMTGPDCAVMSNLIKGLRQKEAHLKSIWAIYNKRSMIFYCSPFWRKNTGEYPPVSIQLNKYPLLAVEITPFWRKHEIISRVRYQYFQAARQGSSALQSQRATAFIVPCAQTSNTAKDASLLAEHGGSTTIVGDHLWWCATRA